MSGRDTANYDYGFDKFLNIEFAMHKKTGDAVCNDNGIYVKYSKHELDIIRSFTRDESISIDKRRERLKWLHECKKQWSGSEPARVVTEEDIK